MIFLDTGFLFAFVSEDDANHVRVVEVLEGYRGRPLGELLLTTNHVVAETITLVRAKRHRDAGVRHDLAVKVGQQLFAGVFGRIHQATAEEERDAFAYLARHRDKDEVPAEESLGVSVVGVHPNSSRQGLDGLLVPLEPGKDVSQKPPCARAARLGAEGRSESEFGRAVAPPLDERHRHLVESLGRLATSNASIIRSAALAVHE